MKKSLKNIIYSVFFVLLILAFIWYIYKNWEDFEVLKSVNPWFIVLLGVLTLISTVLAGMVTDIMVSIFGIKLKFKEWFGLAVITAFYNMITPFRGGMIARAAYLKNKHGFSYTNFLAALAGTYVIDFLTGSLLGLISLWLIYMQTGVFNLIVLLIFLGFALPLLFIVLFAPEFPESKNKWINKFIRVLNGWHLIRHNKKMIITASIRAILQVMIGTIGAYISYGLFGIHLSMAQALFLTTLGSFSVLLAITPAGLGIQEVVAVFSGLVIGITPAQSLSVAILNRAITTIVILVLGPIYSYILLKHKTKYEKENKKKKKSQ